MIDTKLLTKENFDIYIGSVENAINILDYANRLAVEDGGQEHLRVCEILPKIISTKTTSIRLGRWLLKYAKKNNVEIS